MVAPTEIRMVEVGAQSLRVGVCGGDGSDPPLLIFNGVGANLELLEPMTRALGGIKTIVFDVPGIGGSPAPRWPYRMFHLARLADRLMRQPAYGGIIDVLGVSWRGAAAPQFAFQYPRRCRRLVLAATRQDPRGYHSEGAAARRQRWSPVSRQPADELAPIIRRFRADDSVRPSQKEINLWSRRKRA